MCVVHFVCGALCPHISFQMSDPEFLDEKYKICNIANATVTSSKLIPGHPLKWHKNAVKIQVQGNIA